MLEPFDLRFDPILGQALSALGEMLEKLAEQRGMLLGHGLAEIRHLTDFPQQFHARQAAQAGEKIRTRRQSLQGELVVLFAHALQSRMRRHLVERGDQPRHRAVVEFAVAPLDIA